MLEQFLEVTHYRIRPTTMTILQSHFTQNNLESGAASSNW